MTAFLEVVKDFENSESGVEKMSGLITKMEKKAEPYSIPYMKQQLRVHFENNVDFAGKLNYTCTYSYTYTYE